MDDYIKEFFVQVFNGLTPSEQEEFMKHFSAAMGDPYMEELIRFFKQPEMLTQSTKKEAIAEAVRRMEILCFKQDKIDDFKQTGKINTIMENGKYVPIDGTVQKHINMLEEKGFLCYAAIRNESPYGKMTSYLITSRYKEDWDFEYEHVKSHLILSYVYNHDVPYLSEYGSIPVKCLPNGTLIRIY